MILGSQVDFKKIVDAFKKCTPFFPGRGTGHVLEACLWVHFGGPSYGLVPLRIYKSLHTVWKVFWYPSPSHECGLDCTSLPLVAPSQGPEAGAKCLPSIPINPCYSKLDQVPLPSHSVSSRDQIKRILLILLFFFKWRGESDCISSCQWVHYMD